MSDPQELINRSRRIAADVNAIVEQSQEVVEASERLLAGSGERKEVGAIGSRLRGIE